MAEDGKYYSHMERNELIDYCDSHCETERALFSREMVAQMIEYASCPEDYSTPDEIINSCIEFYPMHEPMKTLVDLARNN